MDNLSPYQRLESTRKATKKERAPKGIHIAARMQRYLTITEDERVEKVTQNAAEAQSRKEAASNKQKAKYDSLKFSQDKELEELLAKHKDQNDARIEEKDHLLKQLADMDRAERNRLWSSYNNKKLEIERNYGALKKTLLGEREQEDQKWINDFCNLADEQSELTIHVAPPTAISTPTSTARYPPLDEQIPNTQPSVSAASAQFESPTKAGEQNFRGLRTGASQTPQTRVRESSVTLNKRPMLDSNGQDNTPPSLRRVFSGSGPVQERDTFRLSSSPAPFMSLSGPVTLPIGSPTSLVQSTKRTTQPSTPKPNRHQTISASNTPDGTIKLHSIPVESQSGSFLQSTAFTTPDRSRINTSSKTASQSHTFSPSTPESSSRTSPSLNSSSSSPSAGLTKSLSNNFEIVSVGFENIGGGTFSWMHQPNDPTRYYRLRARSFVPVLKQGKSTGNQDWNIPLDRIWSLKYDADSCLVYMKRIKADKNKTGNAGASMWITFNDRRNLDGFLESYLNQRAGGTVGKIGPDDDVPMSLLSKR